MASRSSKASPRIARMLRRVATISWDWVDT
jgi:hypothetical protein